MDYDKSGQVYGAQKADLELTRLRKLHTSPAFDDSADTVQRCLRQRLIRDARTLQLFSNGLDRDAEVPINREVSASLPQSTSGPVHCRGTKNQHEFHLVEFKRTEVQDPDTASVASCNASPATVPLRAEYLPATRHCPAEQAPGKP